MADRILIVYFSHDGEAYVNGNIVQLSVGNTKVAAGMAGALTGADVFRLRPASPYPNDYGQTIEIAQKELRNAARPELEGKLPDVRAYDAVILGYPNWWGTIPMAMAAFLERCDFSGKTILPLCTNEGSGMGNSEGDIKALCPGADVRPGLAITGGRVRDAGPQIEMWLKTNNLI